MVVSGTIFNDVLTSEASNEFTVSTRIAPAESESRTLISYAPENAGLYSPLTVSVGLLRLNATFTSVTGMLKISKSPFTV